jgi:hypothetical protein
LLVAELRKLVVTVASVELSRRLVYGIGEGIQGVLVVVVVTVDPGPARNVVPDEVGQNAVLVY